MIFLKKFIIIKKKVDNSPNKIWIKNIPERYDE